MDENEYIRQIYKSRNVLLDILKERGFNTDDYSGFSISEIHAMYQNKQLDILLSKPLEESVKEKKIYIKYNLSKTLRPNNTYDIIEDLYNIEQMLKKSDDLIIIIKEEPNETLEKMLKHIWDQEKIFIIIINIQRLQFNILEHTLVPKHIVLSDEEAIEIKKKYNILDDTHIPAISRFSPVSQVIGIRPGQICRIERPSKTSITTNFYRICSQ